ncbi:MAG: hypothetical protein QXU33_04505 [Candidatus Methanomethyliaceae archaeon]
MNHVDPIVQTLTSNIIIGKCFAKTTDLGASRTHHCSFSFDYMEVTAVSILAVYGI